MQRSTRLSVAAAVLCAGVTAAWMFRHDAQPAVPPAGEALVLRQRDAAGSAAGPRFLSESTAAQGAAPGGAAPQSLPGDAQPPLASLPPLPTQAAEDAPAIELAPAGRPFVPPTAEWPGSGFDLENVAAAVDPMDAVRIHRIVDGDSLTGLAEKYLGDAARYLEIFKANRKLLAEPDVLPIGGELKIPPTDPDAAETGE